MLPSANGPRGGLQLAPVSLLVDSTLAKLVGLAGVLLLLVLAPVLPPQGSPSRLGVPPKAGCLKHLGPPGVARSHDAVNLGSSLHEVKSLLMSPQFVGAPVGSLIGLL
jgi:hypothetical protein